MMSDRMDDMEAPTPSWSDIFYEFTQNTTFHGIRYVWDRASKSTFRRFLWLVLFLVATGFFFNQVVERVIYYIGAPVTVKVEVNFNKTLRFPAFIICNQNSFRITVANNKRYKPMLDKFYELEENDPRRLRILESSGYKDLRMDELMTETSHRKEDMIVKCSWKGQECGVENFTQTMTDHGVCFAFNANPDDNPLLLSESGTESALHLVLNIEQYENMIGPHFAAGLKILLYDENDVPVFLGHGQGLAAGSHTFAGTSVVVMRRLPEPFGNCSDNLKLDFYPKYTERACHVECFTKYFTEQAKCKLPYMKGEAPVCTLYTYAEKMRIIQAGFDRLQDSLCHCRPPCESVIYEPRFSYLKASDFDVDKLLDTNTRVKLAKRLIAAHDTLRATEPDLKHRDDKILLDFIKRTHHLGTLLFVLLPDLCARQVEQTKFIETSIRNVYKSIISIYKFQTFVVRKNFYRYVEFSDEMYFSEVSAGYLDFLTGFVERLQRMSSLYSKPGAGDRRQVILDYIETTLDAKNKVIDLGFNALNLCLESYRRGKVMFEPPYQYRNKDPESHDLIIPKHRLRHAVQSHAASVRTPTSHEGKFSTLNDLKTYYVKLKSIAQDCFQNGSLSDGKIVRIRAAYMDLISYYNANRSIMLNDVFIAPLKEVEEYIHDMEDIFQRVHDGFTKISQYLETLNTNWNKTVTKHWPVVKDVLNAALSYTNNTGSGKMDLAKLFLHPKVKDTTQTLYEFLTDVFNVADNVLELWTWIYDQFFTTFLENMVMADGDIIPYLRRYAPGMADKQSFLRTPAYRMISQVLVSHDIWVNFSKTVADIHAPFEDAYRAAFQDMQRYITANEVDTKFYKDNFLSLVIYFQEMNYELIQQQAAYTIFALLSDIGGSMGLFVGGSVISIFEIIDVFLYNKINKKIEQRKRKKRRKRKTDNSTLNDRPIRHQQITSV